MVSYRAVTVKSCGIKNMLLKSVHGNVEGIEHWSEDFMYWSGGNTPDCSM